MKKRLWLAGAFVPLLAVLMIAQPAPSAGEGPGIGGEGKPAVKAAPVLAGEPVLLVSQETPLLDDQELQESLRRLEEELARVQAEIQAKLQDFHRKHEKELAARLARAQELAERAAREGALAAKEHALRTLEQQQERIFAMTEGESGYLGVSITEVGADKAKELKLPAERGVLVTEVEADSPAAKAGLKVNDVITEFNGQRVEGTVQFRRMVGETPEGRTVQLTVWRDGRAQTVSAQLASRRARIEGRLRVYTPREFEFTLPRIEIFGSRTPTIGISAEDLSGQLGEYFGAPGGEGVLVRSVREGTPAARAGLKAGDVITKVNGNRVRTLEEFRERLREKREQKTVALSIIRKGSEMSLNVEIEQPRPAERPRITRRVTL
jgi:serine protease Do